MALDLVTGATGLVGGNLVRALARRGRQVRVLTRRPADLGQPDVEVVPGDLADPASLVAACTGVDRVFHCAARVSLWPPDADAIWRDNVLGTEHLLRAARAGGVRRFVHCSTVDALGLPEGAAPADETTPWNWDRLGLDNPYARSKRAAQERVLEAAQHHLDAVVVNPTYMFGPHDRKPSSGRMILEVAAGRAVAAPAGGNNFVDVRDVAEGLVAAAERGRRGEAYVLGHLNWTYRQAFTAIARAVGRPPPRFTLPRGVARVGGIAGDVWGRLRGREPAVHSITARLGSVGHYYSWAKAERELGFQPGPVETAIADAVHWFREAGMLPRA
ncbi:MAG: SDR family oxidoreductase [Proteobacteria bacterium]|nr:SDR family oxidoreductase [Pseudomonadota bacterium]